MKKEESVEKIQKLLWVEQDLSYKAFQAKLIPGLDEGKIIGVRMPALRKIAKTLHQTETADLFLKQLPHEFYEENNLHGLLINEIKEYESAVCRLEQFLPFVDNWATCDLLAPKAFKKNPSQLPEQIKLWIQSEKEYTVRFGIGMLLKYYLDEKFSPEYLEWVARVDRPEYYIKMMVAWYFATALAKKYDPAIVYIKNQKLDPWTHNKTIQKAIESYRITPEQKNELRQLKAK